MSFAADDGVVFSGITVTQRRNSCADRCRECLSLVNRDTGREDTSFYFCKLGGGQVEIKGKRRTENFTPNLQLDYHISIVMSLVCKALKVAWMDGNVYAQVSLWSTSGILLELNQTFIISYYIISTDVQKDSRQN